MLLQKMMVVSQRPPMGLMIWMISTRMPLLKMAVSQHPLMVTPAISMS
jgi:hypothetical protein